MSGCVYMLDLVSMSSNISDEETCGRQADLLVAWRTARTARATAGTTGTTTATRTPEATGPFAAGTTEAGATTARTSETAAGTVVTAAAAEAVAASIVAGWAGCETTTHAHLGLTCLQRKGKKKISQFHGLQTDT